MYSNAVAPFVYLVNLNCDGVFSDNGFLMMPEKGYDITFTTLGFDDIGICLDGIKIRTVHDTYSNKLY